MTSNDCAAVGLIVLMKKPPLPSPSTFALIGSPSVKASITPGFRRLPAEGVPTVVVGIFVLGLIVEVQHKDSGFAGSVALAIVMLPLMARSTQEVLRLVPGTLREAADSLGVDRWRAIEASVGGRLGVAVLGAGGTMGFAMARNITRAGLSCRAWNRTRT